MSASLSGCTPQTGRAMLTRVHPTQRILLVLQSADPPTSSGGMEAFCVGIAAEFAARGHEVGAVVPETQVLDPLAIQLQSAGATVTRLTTDARNGRWAQAVRWPTLVRLLRRWRPDVVHLHTGGATGGLGVIATARLATAATVVITEHDVPSEAPALTQRLTRRLVDRLSHAQIAVSRRNAKLRRDRLGGTAERLAAVLNGIPMQSPSAATRAMNRRLFRSKLGLEPDRLVAGSLVRLTDGKGLDDLIRAIAIARKTSPIELLLVGDGPMRPALERMAETLQIRDAVHFAGHQPEPAGYLDAMDMFALCVPAGSQSIAVLEAMARGLPPIITFWGPEEPVIPEQTGLIAPPHDPASLAAVLLRLALDEELRSRLGAAAAALVSSNFSVRRVVDDLLELYAAARDNGAPERLRAAPPLS